MLLAWDIIRWLRQRPKLFMLVFVLGVVIGLYINYQTYYIRDLSDRDDIRVSTIVNGDYDNSIVTIPAYVSIEEVFYEDKLESSIAKVRIEDGKYYMHGYIYKIAEDEEGRDDYITARDYSDKLVRVTGEIQGKGRASFMNIEHIDI